MDTIEIERDLQTVEPILNKYRLLGKNKRFGFNLPFLVFARVMRALFTPQSYGGRLQEYIRVKLSAAKVRASEDKGDICHTGTNKEVKVSVSKDGISHFVQIRPHQKVPYLLVVVDLRKTKSPSYTVFELSHSQMQYELSNNKYVSSSHGTKTANSNNTNLEYSIRMPLDSSEFKQWLKQYKSDVIL